jgi:hypothetical protein
MDLHKAGFKVHLHNDCLAYVNHDDHIKAIEEMKAKGVILEQAEI